MKLQLIQSAGYKLLAYMIKIDCSHAQTQKITAVRFTYKLYTKEKNTLRYQTKLTLFMLKFTTYNISKFLNDIFKK